MGLFGWTPFIFVENSLNMAIPDHHMSKNSSEAKCKIQIKQTNPDFEITHALKKKTLIINEFLMLYMKWKLYDIQVWDRCIPECFHCIELVKTNILVSQSFL